jgi:MYXO-CTERM domain-containing protein
LLAIVLLPGCGGDESSGPGGRAIDEMTPATLRDDPEAATEWAQLGSAPNAYGFGSALVSAADLAIQLGATCPTLTEASGTRTYEGGCSDGDDTWTGRAVATEGASGGSIVYEGFGSSSMQDCNGALVPTTNAFDGAVSYAGSALSMSGSFDVDVRSAGVGVNDVTCAATDLTIAVDYHGSIRGAGDASTWSGSGRIGNSLQGYVSVSTDDEVIDDTVCGDEAASGTTTIRSGTHTIVITYDGMTDCDLESTVQWSFDGQESGELSGVQCVVGHRGAPGAGLALLALALLLLRRQR